jgi:hypothetical protein
MKLKIPGFERYEITGITLINAATEKEILPVMIAPNGDAFELRDDQGKTQRVTCDEIFQKLVSKGMPFTVSIEMNRQSIDNFRKMESLVAPTGRKYGKVTSEQAINIRSRLAAGEKASALAREFNVDPSTISLIKAHKIHPVVAALPKQ